MRLNTFLIALLSKLDHKKSSKGTHDQAADVSNKLKAKCAAKICSFQGLNPQNKSAVGTCVKCGNHEHFSCVGITAQYKEDVMLGRMSYICSLCFNKNPSIIQKSPSRPRLNSLPIVAQGYLFKASRPANLKAITNKADLNQSQDIMEVS